MFKTGDKIYLGFDNYTNYEKINDTFIYEIDDLTRSQLLNTIYEFKIDQIIDQTELNSFGSENISIIYSNSNDNTQSITYLDFWYEYFTSGDFLVNAIDHDYNPFNSNFNIPDTDSLTTKNIQYDQSLRTGFPIFTTNNRSLLDHFSEALNTGYNLSESDQTIFETNETMKSIEEYNISSQFGLDQNNYSFHFYNNQTNFGVINQSLNFAMHAVFDFSVIISYPENLIDYFSFGLYLEDNVGNGSYKYQLDYSYRIVDYVSFSSTTVNGNFQVGFSVLIIIQLYYTKSKMDHSDN